MELASGRSQRPSSAPVGARAEPSWRSELWAESGSRRSPGGAYLQSKSGVKSEIGRASCRERVCLYV